MTCGGAQKAVCEWALGKKRCDSDVPSLEVVLEARGAPSHVTRSNVRVDLDADGGKIVPRHGRFGCNAQY